MLSLGVGVLNSNFLTTLLEINSVNIDYKSIREEIEKSIETNSQLLITYVNFYSLIKIKENKYLKLFLGKFNLVHLDGIGIYLGLKFLGHTTSNRFNWSDYTLDFLNLAEQNKWKLYFVGADKNTIAKGRLYIETNYPQLQLMGWDDGYGDVNDKLINKINEKRPDIIWVGMGFPKQEEWIITNYQNLNAPVIQAVGDALRLISNEKPRGPKFIQKIGLEWLVRLIHNPRQYWKRYLLGIPLFIFRVLKEKYKK